MLRGLLRSDLLIFVEIDVGLAILAPSEIEGFDIICGDDVGIGNLLDVAESLVNGLKVFVEIIAFRWQGIHIIVVGEPSVFGVVAFEVDLASRLFCDEVGLKRLELRVDEIPSLVNRLPSGLLMEADAVALAVEVIPPTSYIKVFWDRAVEFFDYVTHPVAVLLFLFKFEHKGVEGVKLGSVACDTISAVAIVSHIIKILNC